MQFLKNMIPVEKTMFAVKNRTWSHNNLSIICEAGGGTKWNDSHWGSWTPAPVTQSLPSLGIANTRKPALPWSQKAKINSCTAPVKSRNMSAPLSRQQLRWPLQARPGLLGALALCSKRINCCRSSSRPAGFTAGLKAETKWGLNSTLTGAFSHCIHMFCSIQNSPNVVPGSF